MPMQLESRDVLTGLAIPFGSQDRKDLQGEWFSKRTDLHLEWFPADGRPVLYHHGLDPDASSSPIGRQTSHEVKADGVWVEVQLAKRSKWAELIRSLLDRDGLGFSSGALPSLVKTVKATGEILSWPWVELSTTPTPASPDARIAAMKYLADPQSLEALSPIAEYHRIEAKLAASGVAQSKALRDEGVRLMGGFAKHEPWCYVNHPADWPCDY